MSFDLDAAPPIAPFPRMIACSRESFAAQNRAADAAGLDWHGWAVRVLELASRATQSEKSTDQSSAVSICD